MSNNAQLPQNEGMYKLLLAASPDPIAIYNMDGEATYVNRLFEETFGWSADELIGERIGFVPEENKEETDWAIKQVFGENGRVQAMDTRRYTKNGRVIDVQLSASLFTDEAGDPAGIIVILRDMTSYKEAENARQHSEERYHLILENIEDGYYEVDMEGIFTFCNDALQTIFGWPREELIGSSYILLMDEEMGKTVYDAFHQVYLTGAPNNGEDWRIIAKDGSIRHINSSVALIKNAQGDSIGCRGIVRDITEQRRAQEELRRSEERYRTIVESIQDGYYEIDLLGRHTFINAATSAIFGHPVEKILGLSYKDYTDKETAAKVYAVYNEVYTTGNPVRNYEYPIINKHGEKLDIGVSISLIRDADGNGVGFRGLMRDVTARIEAERNLRQAHDDLEARIEERTLELLDLNASLVEEVAERTNAEDKIKKSYESEEVLNTLLQLSMKDAPLNELLGIAFDAIISTSWFGALPMGSIFLVEDDPNVLELAVKHRLDKKLHTLCDRVPFGTCLCGKAAATREIVFADCLGHDHDVTYDGMADHGHYDVPILIDHKVVGVLNLYVEHGHERTDREIAFLKAVAHTLSGLIRQKRAEKALRKSEFKTRAVVEHALDAIVAIDDKGIVLDWNPQAEKIFGWTADEMIGQELTNKIIPKRHRKQHTKGIKRFLSTGKRRVLNQRIELEGVHKDGYEFPIELSISELTEGDSYTFSAFIRDITHRKAAEEALKNSEEKFRQLFEQSADAILLLGEGAYIDCNAATVKMMRAVDKNEFLSVHPSALSPATQPDGRDSGEKADEMIQIAFEKGTHQFEWVHRRMDEVDFPVEVTLTVVPWEGKQALYTVWRDITERKQASDALRDSEFSARIFQEKLRALQALSVELTHAETMDDLYVQAVTMGRKRLGFDRFGLLLHDAEAGEYVGTMGTNENGELVDESNIHGEITEPMRQVLEGDKRPLFFEDFDLKYADSTVGHGWAMLSGIWDGENLIGWLAVDNLITQEDAYPYELELLSLYGISLGSVIAQKKAEQVALASLERRGQQMKIATMVAQEIATLSSLSGLYDHVVELVKEEFGFYHVQLFIYDEMRERVTLVSSYGEIGKHLLAERFALRLGVGLVGTAVSTQQSILRPDVSADSIWRSNVYLPDTKGELASPIILRGQIMGVLDVQSDEVNALTTDDALVIGGLCGQIATAIGSINLARETEMRLDELNALQRNRSREGWEAQSGKYGAIGYQYDHTGLQAYTLIDPDGTAVLNEHTTSTDDVETAVFAPPLITNLSIRGQQFGILGIEEDPNQPLTDAERELFQQISEQVSEALEAARLFEQTQESLSEQERLTSELGTVAEVSTAASTILETDKLLQVVVDLAKESFNLYHAHVYLLDEGEDRLVLQAGSGTIGRLMVLEGREVSMSSRALVAQVARQKNTIIENWVSDVTSFLPHPLLPDTKSEMAVPLVVGKNLIGVMDLQSDQEGYFTDDDIQIQRTLGSQIAVSIQNARLYAEQVAAAKKLRQVDQLKSEFLASMSHELRTPLNSIIGFSDILLEGLDGDLTERMDEDVRLIRGSGIHLRDLIGEILDMSKIEAGRMDLRYEEIDMVQMVSEIVATAKPLSDEKSLYLDLHISPDVEYVEADRMRFRQILYNIVSNAIKFTEKGGVTIDVRMNDENYLLVSIQDTGIGIKPEDISVVFEQFRQIDGSLNRVAGGTGLGMPITRNLVELHGGQIWIESTYGFGSTFLFTMPRYRIRKRKETGLLV